MIPNTCIHVCGMSGGERKVNSEPLKLFHRKSTHSSLLTSPIGQVLSKSIRFPRRYTRKCPQRSLQYCHQAYMVLTHGISALTMDQTNVSPTFKANIA